MQMPSAATLHEVRKFNARTLELHAYALSEAGQKQRRAMNLPPVTPIRSATEAEMVEIAQALEAGAILNPRMWFETFKVRSAADVVQLKLAA